MAYRPYNRGGPSASIPAPADRQRHGQRLRGDLESAALVAATRRQQAPVVVDGAVDGFYATFDSFPGLRLALTSLDPRQGRRHPELMSVQEIPVAGGGVVERATVFVPEGTVSYFLDRLTDYADTAGTTAVKNRALVDPIQSVRLATIEALWTDPPQTFPPAGQRVWWEVWLRRRDGHELERLRAFAAASGARVGRQHLGFGDRTVVLVQASVEQLAGAVDVLDDLAELRAPSEPAIVLTRMPPAEQREWIDDLLGRLEPAGREAPSVCVVDSGVFRDHLLLESSLDTEDCHAADPSWPVQDDRGHGTEMAGLALFGDLATALSGSTAVRPTHRLESVKILPPPPADNPPELYAAVTVDGITRAEIQAPHRRRVHSLAITVPQDAPPDGGASTRVVGQPSSWSAALDALAVGRSVIATEDGLEFLDLSDEATDAVGNDAGEPGGLPAGRLFVVSAGNVRRPWQEDHLTLSDLRPVEDPAQAWNVLTVGAFTERDSMSDAPAEFAGWTPLAARGELSPFSRTSMTYNKPWPTKPDVVLEGGNIARSSQGEDLDTPDNLQLLTTNAPLRSARLLTTTNATSAATAQAAALAAAVWAGYPSLWPETVRALVVHSAEWTPTMKQHLDTAKGLRARARLLRRYGMGVPDLTRATRSATDALTLVTQNVVHPFEDGAMREIHFHDLPWPTDVLADLGATQVQLRVTLSYFIEPNPGRRGWRRRYSYASHGMRFDLRTATESQGDFEKRLNKKALAEEEQRPTISSTDVGWYLGAEHQSAPGCLHTDIWTGTAIDLANRGAVAVYPVTGWWKENPTRDHSDNGARYALILSITTPETNTDIWTPVAQQIGVPIAIET